MWLTQNMFEIVIVVCLADTAEIISGSRFGDILKSHEKYDFLLLFSILLHLALMIREQSWSLDLIVVLSYFNFVPLPQGG